MRQRRGLLGMSQKKLGAAVGLTFQQIQKYERGANRVGASRLYEFAKVLDVAVSHFFSEMPPTALARRSMSGPRSKNLDRPGAPFKDGKDPLVKRETLVLVRAYYQIGESRVRKCAFEMVKALGTASLMQALNGRKTR
jgi:transcriptional regulator with XRE-family HTH domain